jgi:DNA-binding response OmpR family regulator
MRDRLHRANLSFTNGASGMAHALILDENMAVNRAMEDRLVSLGFNSFDHTWTEAQALAAASYRRPDIVVIGAAISSGSPIAAAEHIAERFGSPILLVSAGLCEVRRQFACGAILDGPFSLAEIEAAVEVACGILSQAEGGLAIKNSKDKDVPARTHEIAINA